MQASLLCLMLYTGLAILSTEAYNVVLHVKQRFDDQSGAAAQCLLALTPVLRFVITRLCYLFIGCDAFLVKLRLAQDIMYLHDLNYLAVLRTAAFIYQKRN